MSINHMIVIGTSAGGVEALKELVPHISPDIDAPILIVLHTSPHAPSLMPKILNHVSKLPVSHPKDGQPMENGHIYIAPPDYHLLVKDGCMRLAKGPKENGFRPSIDSLFRSAARAYGAGVIGVVLTGSLDNGSAGLMVVKARGGTTIVQDPDDALYREMPINAIKAAEPDYILPLQEIPAQLLELTLQEATNTRPSGTLSKEADYVETAQGNNVYDEPGRQVSTLTCPECGGVLSEYEDEHLLHFKCRVGHAYSADTLLALQSEELENALWAALRALEENTELAQRLEERARAEGRTQIQQRYGEKASDSRHHADVLRAMLLRWV